MEAECSRLGKPVHGAEATVLEDEQRGTTVAITGPAVMDGYHAQPDLTDESVETIAGTRWVRTNALASVATETAVRVK